MLEGYQFVNGTFRRTVRTTRPPTSGATHSNATLPDSSGNGGRVGAVNRLDSRSQRWHRRDANNNGQANLIIASGMLCIVLIVVILVMYISQRSFRKRGVAVYQQHRGWLEAEGVLDVYTVDRYLDVQPQQPANEMPSDADRLLSNVADANIEPNRIRSQQQHRQRQRQQYRDHNHAALQPPPSYESVVAVGAFPLVHRAPAVSNVDPMASSFTQPLLGRPQQVSHSNCCCQKRERQRPAYDIIKKCRQCRKQIRSDDDDDNDDDNSNDVDANVRYCECMLPACSRDEHGDDDDNAHVCSGDATNDDRRQTFANGHEREPEPQPQTQLGKPIRAIECTANSTTSVRAAAPKAAQPSTSVSMLSTATTADVATRTMAGATNATASARADVQQRCAAVADVVAAGDVRGNDVDDDDDNDDDNDDDDDNDNDSRRRLVPRTTERNDEADMEKLMDNSGLPTYNAAASRLRPKYSGQLD